MKTLQDDFARLMDAETILSLETLWILAPEAEEWECLEHDGCRQIA